MKTRHPDGHEVFPALYGYGEIITWLYSLLATCFFCHTLKGQPFREHGHGHHLGQMNASLFGTSARELLGASDPLVFTCRTLENTM